MGQTLTNGIYLPAEGERNCYEGLAANWTALDGLIGGYNVHIGNTAIHVTAEDKAAWNGKADASALTAHTGDTTIHVTSADKQAWDGHVADSVKHVTAADKAKWDAVTSKADDSDVVHKSGNETITGTKTFENVNIQLKSTSAEYSVSGGYKSVSFHDKNLRELSRTRLGVYSSGLSYIKQTILGYDSNNQQVDTTITFSWSSLIKPFLRPDSDNLVSLGTSGSRWKEVYATNYYYGSNNVEFSTKFVTTDTAQTVSGNKTFSSINGVEPSSLSLPSDRSARVDISSYFTNTGTGQSNSYTVPANGYIYLTLSELTNVHCFSRSSGNVTNYAQTFTKLSDSTGALYILFPVRKNDVFVATWYTTTTVSVDGAFFIPCKGNI